MELIDGKYGPKKRPQDLTISMCIDWDSYSFVKYDVVEGNKGDGDRKEKPESYKEENKESCISIPGLSQLYLHPSCWTSFGSLTTAYT